MIRISENFKTLSKNLMVLGALLPDSVADRLQLHFHEAGHAGVVRAFGAHTKITIDSKYRIPVVSDILERFGVSYKSLEYGIGGMVDHSDLGTFKNAFVTLAGPASTITIGGLIFLDGISRVKDSIKEIRQSYKEDKSALDFLRNSYLSFAPKFSAGLYEIMYGSNFFLHNKEEIARGAATLRYAFQELMRTSSVYVGSFPRQEYNDLIHIALIASGIITAYGGRKIARSIYKKIRKRLLRNI